MGANDRTPEFLILSKFHSNVRKPCYSFKEMLVVKYCGCFFFCHLESLKYIIHLLKFILKDSVIEVLDLEKKLVIMYFTDLILQMRG